MKNIVISLFFICLSSTSMADNIPFSHPAHLFDASNSNTLGLSEAPGSETITVFAPSDETDHFSNGVVMIAFKGALYWYVAKFTNRRRCCRYLGGIQP